MLSWMRYILQTHIIKLSPLQMSVDVHYSITDDTPVWRAYMHIQKQSTHHGEAMRLIRDILDIAREDARCM